MSVTHRRYQQKPDDARRRGDETLVDRAAECNRASGAFALWYDLNIFSGLPEELPRSNLTLRAESIPPNVGLIPLG